MPELARGRTTYEFHELVVRGSGNKTLALQVRCCRKVVAKHYAATVQGRSLLRTTIRSGSVACCCHSASRLALVAEGDKEGAQEHWLRHMQTAATTLLGDDLKNRRLIELFD